VRFSVLGSGSKGNSVFIESGSTSILIDAGFSGKGLEARLGAVDRSLVNVQAICITHEHNDHICGAGVVSRRCQIPAYANYGTFKAGEKRMGKLFKSKEFETGDTLTIGDLKVRSFRISHDTADPVGYVISDGTKSVGYCTDTGKVSHLMAQRLRGCNALILEFNHNLEMLKNGPYPLPLQQRVRSSLGHLSNDDAAAFLEQFIDTGLEHLILAHISEKNNTPQLAAEAAKMSLVRGSGISMHIAPQERPLELIGL